MSSTESANVMRAIAGVVDEALNGAERPKPNGFVVLVFPNDGAEGSRTNYVSNCDRKEILVALKEVVARFEGQPQQSGRA